MSKSNMCTVNSDDVNELVDSMMNELMYWQSFRNNENDGIKCSLIYKVLQCIRAADPNAYEPSVLSIGPYHHGIPSLFPMEKEKWLCLDYVLKLNCNRSLYDYLAVITRLQSEVRSCYSEDNILNSRMFVEMLLLDSCFIIVCLNGIDGVKIQGVSEEYSHDQHVLTEIGFGKGKESLVEGIPKLSCRTKEYIPVMIEQEHHVDTHQDYKHGNNVETYYGQNQENIDMSQEWYNSSAVYDLLLLENQIPFFVVAKIYELLVDGERIEHRLLSDNLSKFVEGILLHFPLAIHDTDRPKDFDHLLHLCYMYFKPSHGARHKHQLKKSIGYFKTILFWVYKFFCSNNVGSQETEEIPLSQAYSEPLISVKEFQRWRRAEQYHEAGVEFKARAFDKHNPHSLVPDDVALLSRKGVIVHQLDNDEEVSNLFARLLEYIVFDFSDGRAVGDRRARTRALGVFALGRLPRRLWELLSAVGYPQPPLYEGHDFVESGLRRCSVTIVIPQHALNRWEPIVTQIFLSQATAQLVDQAQALHLTVQLRDEQLCEASDELESRGALIA
ncbi:uncharacterized protein LOC120702017 [Panicum virgatum]|uniref:uncharacterized protein LOC120702017 n=1 Tax=Panicum virgatum TaxID=38727 RepID=UPI0019D5EB05|nr:uncharacterized protein LOC120702017 [Panicum virgatum]